MKEIEKLILQKMLFTLRLEKAKIEHSTTDYVFGSDDCFRIIISEIDKLN